MAHFKGTINQCLLTNCWLSLDVWTLSSCISMLSCRISNISTTSPLSVRTLVLPLLRFHSDAISWKLALKSPGHFTAFISDWSVLVVSEWQCILLPPWVNGGDRFYEGLESKVLLCRYLRSCNSFINLCFDLETCWKKSNLWSNCFLWN